MPLYDRIMLRKTNLIESVNDMLKNVAHIVHTRHHSVHIFIMNVLAAMGHIVSFQQSHILTLNMKILPLTGNS